MTPYGYPSELYHCLLDEQPYYLTPLRLLPEYVPGQEYIVNPNCWFSWHGPLMPDKAARASWIEDLCPSEHIVWVDDPATGIIWPFWVGEEYFSYLSQLAPGYPVTFDMPEHVKWVLTCANIFTTPNWTAHRQHDWMEVVHESAASFERGYVPLSGLIHPFHVGALRRYYRYQVRTGAFKFGDGQVSRRYAEHNEKVTRFFHHQLTGAISAIARTVLKPSYSYFLRIRAVPNCIATPTGLSATTVLRYASTLHRNRKT